MLQCAPWRIVVVDVIWDRWRRRIVVCTGLKSLKWNLEVN